MSELKQQRFAKVDTSYNFPALELEIMNHWDVRDIFRKSLAKPAPKGNWVFYEGPPTANSLPHAGHVLTRVIKDCLPRFKTMQGYFVRRQAGWDTHGLPVELSVEKELLNSGEMTESGPEAIRAYGIDKFNARCFESVRRYEQEWVRLSNRIAFWLDYDHAYFTFTNRYVESVWWLLKQAYDRGLMYKGHRIQWYSTLVGTGLSSHEVAQNWQTVKDPSVWVRCQVPEGVQIGDHTADDHTYFLVWTTTPWTLLSNVAICVHPDYDYVVVEFHNKQQDRREFLILAEALLKANGLESEKIVARVKGRELAGLSYKRLFNYDVPDIRRDGAAVSGWHVVVDEYVTLEDGTGIVHIAPAFGEDDYRIGLRDKLPFLLAMDRDGRAIEAIEIAPGKWFKDVDPDVITDLKHRGLLFRTQKVEHNYPHCYRTDAPLMSYPLDSWFIKVTEIKDQLIANNQKITWQPEHIRDGRFGDWLNNVIDWSLSRDRFWGTPLPVWLCDNEHCQHEECIGSYAELKEKCPQKFEGVTDLYDREQFNPHRPYIDDFSWPCPQCGGRMTRESYIIDPWFDAGAMPFCQMHYPFENAELVDCAPGQGQFPADFISEAVDQTRGWFYTLHVIATLIKDSPAYKSCLVLGHTLDSEGHKMSKSRGNVTDPWKVIDNHGADAFRWYFFSSGNLFASTRFTEASVVESLQRFIIPLWNIYSFFTIYGNIDDFDPATERLPWQRLTELDRVALIKLNNLTRDVTAHMERLEINEAAKRFEAAVEFFSNWYVRRSRRRFWQSEHDDAKLAAYQTLYAILTTLARLLAPFMPFISEELYRRLVVPFDASAPESVHLADYPLYEPAIADQELEFATDQARRVVGLGHAARKESGVRVRQPLSKVTLICHEDKVKPAVEQHADVILDELNVKAIEWAEDETEFVSFEYKPVFREIGPRFGKQAKHVANWIGSHANEITRQLEQRRSEDEDWTIEFTLEGEQMRIDAACLEVHLKEKPETVAQRDGQLLLVLDTHISDELRLEGLAREVVNRLQNKRKQLDLDYTDRIRVCYSAPDALQQAIDAHREYITGETLAEELARVDSVDGEPEETKIDEMELRFTVERV